MGHPKQLFINNTNLLYCFISLRSLSYFICCTQSGVPSIKILFNTISERLSVSLSFCLSIHDSYLSRRVRSMQRIPIHCYRQTTSINYWRLSERIQAEDFLQLTFEKIGMLNTEQGSFSPRKRCLN